MTGFWYLATPYSKYPLGTTLAHQHACELAARLFRAGINVYSPIAHTHAIETIGQLGIGFEHWAEFDEALITASEGVIVAMMQGWRESAGIAAEIAICTRLDKPVRYMETTLNFVEGPP